MYKYIRQLKFVALVGAFAMAWNEKDILQKKWAYYNRFYPEQTQLQRQLINDAFVLKQQDALKSKQQEYTDPETQKIYEQFYMLHQSNDLAVDTNVVPITNDPKFGES